MYKDCYDIQCSTFFFEDPFFEAVGNFQNFPHFESLPPLSH